MLIVYIKDATSVLYRYMSGIDIHTINIDRPQTN